MSADDDPPDRSVSPASATVRSSSVTFGSLPLRTKPSRSHALTCSSSVLIVRSVGFGGLSVRKQLLRFPCKWHRRRFSVNEVTTTLNQVISDRLRCCGNCLQESSVHIDPYKTCCRSVVCHHSRPASRGEMRRAAGQAFVSEAISKQPLCN